MKITIIAGVLLILSISLVTSYNINHENVEKFLSEHDIIKNLPSSAVVLIHVGKENYIMKKGVFEKGFTDEKIDATISINEKYLDELKSDNFYDIMKKIVSEKGYKYQRHISFLEIFWKYKCMLKYSWKFGI